MKINNVRGALLEEIVLNLLQSVGYRVIRTPESGMRDGRAGLEVRGRGAWHQIDGLAAFDHTPAFMYPLRLLVEAKCYQKKYPIKINVPRNALGVLRDITENYFTIDAGKPTELQVQRFNYHSAIFSTSGYTSGAQRFAIAHQIFLIQYDHVPLMQPIADALLDMTEEHLKVVPDKQTILHIRREFQQLLKEGQAESDIFSSGGTTLINERIRPAVEAIAGSYYGMLQGQYPMHLLSKQPLPAGLFKDKDSISCHVSRSQREFWYFAPSDHDESNYFRLEFNLPKEIALLVQKADSSYDIANAKRAHFSYIDLSGKIGDVHRTVRLELDEEWLDRFLTERE